MLRLTIKDWVMKVYLWSSWSSVYLLLAIVLACLLAPLFDATSDCNYRELISLNSYSGVYHLVAIEMILSLLEFLEA